eukprot:TRINITY_DN2715_c0_g1_i5.p1 TRINITY_DN2715_c0_g1~~TRINITY_DN2715_c0_g1_i5.p1  ORF type:complete len:362 (-),score=68.87 TRINITY_DN2715_c0_g1_i5:43-1128(-)
MLPAMSLRTRRLLTLWVGTLASAAAAGGGSPHADKFNATDLLLEVRDAELGARSDALIARLVAAGPGALFDQCGGSSWMGSTSCQAGLECQYVSEWMSQCKASGGGPPPPAASPPAASPAVAAGAADVSASPGRRVVAASYNLFWWCVSNQFGNCPQNAGGSGFRMLYDRIQQNGPYDLIGFQECDNGGQIMADTGMASNFDYWSDPNSDLTMAWNRGRFEKIQGPESAVIGGDRYGARWVNWVRLKSLESGTVIFFANTHGPLDQCWGGQGQGIANNYIQVINARLQPGDKVVFTGDFNCGRGSDMIRSLAQVYKELAVDNSFGGADHIFSSAGVPALEKVISNGIPSDHELLKASFAAL